MDSTIQRILEEHERIIRSSKQQFLSLFIMICFVFLSLLGIGGLFYIVSDTSGSTCTINDEVRPPEDCAGIIRSFSYICIGLALGVILYTYLTYLVTYYVITEKRIIIKSGIIGADIRSLYFDQIRSVFVNVGIVGKLCKSGTIDIDTGRVTETKKGTKSIYDSFTFIEQPYEAYRIIQSILSKRKESLYSGRADYEENTTHYTTYVQETEKIKHT